MFLQQWICNLWHIFFFEIRSGSTTFNRLTRFQIYQLRIFWLSHKNESLSPIFTAHLRTFILIKNKSNDFDGNQYKPCAKMFL